MQRHLHIHFNDGDRLEVSFPEQGDSQTIATRVQKALEALTLAVEVEGQLYAIPVTSIKYLQLSPAPDTLPDTVIRGASMKPDPG